MFFHFRDILKVLKTDTHNRIILDVSLIWLTVKPYLAYNSDND